MSRPPVDHQKRDREAQRRVLEAALLACYEIIDRIRRELAALAATKGERT